MVGPPADLGERGGSGGHQDLTHSVVEALHRFIVHTQETLRRPLFGHLRQTQVRELKKRESYHAPL